MHKALQAIALCMKKFPLMQALAEQNKFRNRNGLKSNNKDKHSNLRWQIGFLIYKT